MDWYLKVLKQYADFRGRARRKEYWMFTLIHLCIFFVLAFLTVFLTNDFNGIIGIYFIATFIPFLAVTARRLHDIGKSGWWYLINFVPYIGGFVILIFTCMDGNIGVNQWGENPKGIGNDNDISKIGTE
ncbi:UNVERIFIED_CONTAM: hypothetical protein GTU68_032230 [Idotea baltica]|nr:hypothetical protein [Idotea baltica]